MPGSSSALSCRPPAPAPRLRAERATAPWNPAALPCRGSSHPQRAGYGEQLFTKKAAGLRRDLRAARTRTMCTAMRSPLLSRLHCTSCATGQGMGCQQVGSTPARRATASPAAGSRPPCPDDHDRQGPAGRELPRASARPSLRPNGSAHESPPCALAGSFGAGLRRPGCLSAATAAWRGARHATLSGTGELVRRMPGQRARLPPTNARDQPPLVFSRVEVGGALLGDIDPASGASC